MPASRIIDLAVRTFFENELTGIYRQKHVKIMRLGLLRLLKSDDHRYDAMSFMGHPLAETPHLDWGYPQRVDTQNQKKRVVQMKVVQKKKKIKQYDEDFKKSSVELFLRSGKKQRQFVRELGFVFAA